MTYLGAAAGLVIASDTPLPGLCPTQGPASFSVSFASVDVTGLAVEWIQEWLLDRRCWLAAGRVSNGYVLRFTGIADVLVDVASRRILAEPHSTADREAVVRLVAGQVIPRLLTLDGTPVLHASAIALDGAAIVFAAESGAGKSTLAAAMCAAGARLLADDFVALHTTGAEFQCPPTSPSVNLSDSSLAMLRDAFPVRSARGWCGSVPAPMRAIHLLEWTDEHDASLTPVQPRAALLRLLRLAYRLDPAAPHIVASEFTRLGAAAAALPVCILRLPREPRRLRTTVDAILRWTCTAPVGECRRAERHASQDSPRAKIEPRIQESDD